jgi:8-oxo-dGTP pyrophosphatase MutT (NUDIX family)
MFERMTVSEREFIKNNTFDMLWNTLWVDNKKNHAYYKVVRDKFNLLKTGYHIKGKEGTYLFNLEIALNACEFITDEQEWEFPKGRRKLGEKDFQCAIREFQEESNIGLDDVFFCDSSRYFEEVYLSMNKIRYRNIYYIGKYIKCNNNVSLFDNNNTVQTKEVRDVNWFSFDEVKAKLSNRNPEKYEMFKLANDIIRKKYEITLE